jgi:hypothetical protein
MGRPFDILLSASLHTYRLGAGAGCSGGLLRFRAGLFRSLTLPARLGSLIGAR